MFEKILIANRGEIACRIAKTARKMGIPTVAVFSDADQMSPHVKACDEAFNIGGMSASESYLNIERIIEVCRESGADAVHPGYGFLSENPKFPTSLEQNGIVFIGPSAETIERMGNKSEAKILMQRAGVPTTPGYQGKDQNRETFQKEAEAIGFPVLLKAVAGGGGKGMRLVERADDLASALKSAKREAQASFGDDRFLMEKYLHQARHLEVQIFGDGAGNIVHVFERDCSIQRRHQKIIEEAPAPNLPDAVRTALLSAGVNAGKAVNYRGAGTIEFLYDQHSHEFYFMEMNTRLQVEHPVSEMISSLDFVEWQILIAAGKGLPLQQSEIKKNGWSFEARLYAENPRKDFSPSIGTISSLNFPDREARVDTGITEGQEITPYYDPMIAKLIVHAEDREQSLARLRKALQQTRVAGVDTNSEFLFTIANHQRFIDAKLSTNFIDTYSCELFDKKGVHGVAIAAAALHQYLGERDDDETGLPWSALNGFRINAPANSIFWFATEETPALVELQKRNSVIELTLKEGQTAIARKQSLQGGAGLKISIERPVLDDGGSVSFTSEGKRIDTFVRPHKDGLRVWIGPHQWDLQFANPLESSAAGMASGSSLLSPIPGVIIELSASAGDQVAAGQPLLSMEAMKMEHTIKAPYNGVVKAYKFRPGDQVSEGDLLVEFSEIED